MDILGLAKVIKKTVETQKKKADTPWTSGLAKSLAKFVPKDNPVRNLTNVVDTTLTKNLTSLARTKGLYENIEKKFAADPNTDPAKLKTLMEKTRENELAGRQAEVDAIRDRNMPESPLRGSAMTPAELAAKVKEQSAQGSSLPVPRPKAEVMAEAAGRQQPEGSALGEVGRFGVNALGETARLGTGLVDTAVNTLSNLPGLASPMGMVQGFNKAMETAGGPQASTSLGEMVDPFIGQAEEAATQITGVPTESWSGGLGKIVPYVASLFAGGEGAVASKLAKNPKLASLAEEGLQAAGKAVETSKSKGILSLVQDVISPGKRVIEPILDTTKLLGESKTGLGTLVKGERLLAGKSGAYGSVKNRIENAINAAPEMLKTFTKKTISNVADTTAVLALTEKRAPTKEELLIGRLIGGAMDVVGKTLEKTGINLFNRAYNMFQGAGENENIVKTTVEKLKTAFDEGYAVPSTAEQKFKKAVTKIATYGGIIKKEIEKSGKKFEPNVFFQNIYKKLDGMERTNPVFVAEAKRLIDKLSGKELQDKMFDLKIKIGDLNKVVEGAEKSSGTKIHNYEIDARKYYDKLIKWKKSGSNPLKEPKMPDVAAKNYTRGVVDNSLRNIQALTIELSALEKQYAKASQPITMPNIAEWKSIAADMNPRVVGGIVGETAADAASRKAWMMVRDETETYLNSLAPGIKDINNRLNVAYRMKDLAREFLANPDKKVRGTGLAEASKSLGDLLQGALPQQATKYGVIKTGEGAQGALEGLGNLASAAYNVPGQVANQAGAWYNQLTGQQ